MRKLAFLLIVFLTFFYGICDHQQESNDYKNEEYNTDFRSLCPITQQSSRYYKFKCMEPGLYANVNHCRIYYKCVKVGHKHRLRKSVHKCKTGTVFSYALNGICIPPAESERVECGGYPQSTDNHNSVTEQTTVPNDFSVENNEREITLQIDGETNPKSEQHEEYKSDKLKMPISSSSKKRKRDKGNEYENEESNVSKSKNHESNETEVTTQFILTEEQVEKEENVEFEVTIPKISHEKKKKHEAGESDITTSDISTEERTESNKSTKSEITTLEVPQEEKESHQSGGVEMTTLHILTEGQTEREDSVEPDITTPEVHLGEEKRHESGEAEVTTLHIPEEQTESGISTESEITTSQIPNKESEEDESYDINTTMEITTDISTDKIESGIDDSEQNKTSLTTQIPSVPDKSDDEINLRCTSAGFFPEPSDCTKYYRCVQFGTILEKYKFVCPKGTVWDQRIMTCNFANVENLSCKKKIEDLSDISQEKHEITNKYQKPTTIIIESSISTKLSTMPTVPSETISPVKNLTDDRTPFVCPTGFRRHPKYCNLFYQCIASSTTEVKIVIFKCSEGTIFNDKKIRCVREAKVREIFPGNVNCKIFNSLLPDISVANLNIPAIKLCPGEGRYPYNKNCSNIYYDCKRDSYGILQGYLLNCPNGLIYSNILRRCKHAKYFPMCRARHPL